MSGSLTGYTNGNNGLGQKQAGISPALPTQHERLDLITKRLAGIREMLGSARYNLIGATPDTTPDVPTPMLENVDAKIDYIHNLVSYIEGETRRIQECVGTNNPTQVGR